MSAFVVNTDHIDLMVSYALYNIGPAEPLRAFIEDGDGENIFYTVVSDMSGKAHNEQITATELGRLLLLQNVRSVVGRYQAAPTEELRRYSDMAATYQHRPVERLFRLAEAGELEATVINACRCYDYQASESGDLSETEAGQWSELIYRKAANAMADRLSQGWEWTRSQLPTN